MIGPFRQYARIAQVRVEISVQESSIAAFKLNYGVDPPSGLTLHSTKEGWDGDRKSRDAIRQLWPNFDFTTCGGLSNVPAHGIRLNGAECLVFFLGGVCDPASGIPIGFKKHLTQPLLGGNGREHPLYEFDRKRLIDLDGDGYREYLDPYPAQTKPYLYISSNEGSGYDLADLDGAMDDVYRQGSGADAEPWKPQGFQIISPGIDREYGYGGGYDPNNDELQRDQQRKAEFDNLTNFSADVLVRVPSTFFSNDSLVFLSGSLLVAAVAAWFCWRKICDRCDRFSRACRDNAS